MKGRVHFNSPDPKTGDASINLTSLQPSDTGTYQCKVKKAPGIRSRKMQLTVMGEALLATWHQVAYSISTESMHHIICCISTISRLGHLLKCTHWLTIHIRFTD